MKGEPPSLQGSPYTRPVVSRDYSGADFSTWRVALGDGIYAAPGEGPVTADDIATYNYGTHSLLVANTNKRGIMAHNITVLRMVAEDAFNYVHICGYKFRIPYIPSTGNTDLNAQTLEGGFFIWDGGNTRLDYGLAFQWMLNPWGGDDFAFGDLRCWTGFGVGAWQKVGQIEVDTAWHEIRFVFDFRRETTAMVIDGRHFPSCFTATEKDESWSSSTEPGLQAEIISLWPGFDGANGALHKAEFRDWYWLWEPYGACSIYLPAVLTN